MEISQLRAVLAIAKSHSFSRAAQELYLSQSTLSLQVAKLEKELGVTLFYRTTRTVHLTEAGEEFVKSAGDILRNIRLLSQNMSAYGGLMRGTLTIGAISSLEAIHFSEMLASFYSLYPSLNIDLQEEGSITLIEMLRSHRIAQAFVVVGDPSLYPDLHFTYLGRDEYHLAVSRLHRLARRKTVEIADLENENLITHQGANGINAILDNAFRSAVRNQHHRTGSYTCALRKGKVCVNAQSIPVFGTFRRGKERKNKGKSALRKNRLPL